MLTLQSFIGSVKNLPIEKKADREQSSDNLALPVLALPVLALPVQYGEEENIITYPSIFFWVNVTVSLTLTWIFCLLNACPWTAISDLLTEISDEENGNGSASNDHCFYFGIFAFCRLHCECNDIKVISQHI